MAKVREIVVYPDPILRVLGKVVTSFDKKLHVLLDDMVATMYHAGGIGLAAQQIGEAVQVAVVHIDKNDGEPIELVNPEIIASSDRCSSEEGCLSIPGFRETIKRYKAVKVKAQDRYGKSFEIEGEGLLSFCLQHEIDHLNGVLFIDHLSPLKKGLFKKWLKF